MTCADLHGFWLFHEQEQQPQGHIPQLAICHQKHVS
jgi:hypothetical protein